MKSLLVSLIVRLSPTKISAAQTKVPNNAGGHPEARPPDNDSRIRN